MKEYILKIRVNGNIIQFRTFAYTVSQANQNAKSQYGKDVGLISCTEVK